MKPNDTLYIGDIDKPEMGFQPCTILSVGQEFVTVLFAGRKYQLNSGSLRYENPKNQKREFSAYRKEKLIF